MRSLLCALTVLFFGAAGSAYGETLTCRGGAATIGMTSTGQAVMYFKKSNTLAGAGLQPGFCAFANRGITAAEPLCLQQLGVNATAWITPGNLPSSTASTSTHYQANAANTQWMRDLLSAANYKSFNVTGNSNGCFRVTPI